MTTRKYYLDWLRVLAFVLLILFHTGMLYVGWSYNLKSPRVVSDLEWLMIALLPWRLALLFVISGVVCRFLIEKLGAVRFALDRTRRLLLPILVGMFVVIPPQTWIMLVDKGLTRASYLHFWLFTYLPADQTLVRPLRRTMPTWDHLWFLVYLLAYTLVFAFLWTLTRARTRRPNWIPLSLLLTVPAVWLVFANMTVERLWPRTDAFVGDWGEHLKWIGMFVAGLCIAKRENVWRWLQGRRASLLMVSAILLGLHLRGHQFWLKGDLHAPWDWIVWSTTSGLYGWAMILTVCGYATRYLNRPSAALSYLNEAILPVYVLHQPILLLSAYAVFSWRLPLPQEAAVLIAVTVLGSLAIYQLAIKPFNVMRFLFGLKPNPAHKREAHDDRLRALPSP